MIRPFQFCTSGIIQALSSGLGGIVLIVVLLVLVFIIVVVSGAMVLIIAQRAGIIAQSILDFGNVSLRNLRKLETKKIVIWFSDC